MRRWLFAAGAAVNLTAALLLIISVGLPQRADFTGQRSDNLALPIAPEIGALAPDFTRSTIHGEPITLADLRGRPVIINFWATWCQPCLVEMPILQTLYEAYQDAGLRILAINLGEAPAAIQHWQERLGLSYDMIIDEEQTVATRYFLRGQPSTYVVTPDGIISHIFYGPVREAALQQALAPYT